MGSSVWGFLGYIVVQISVFLVAVCHCLTCPTHLPLGYVQLPPSLRGGVRAAVHRLTNPPSY